VIVADTNLIVYLYLPSPDTAAAEQLSLDEPDWAAPSVWRSEFRNVLALHMRKGLISLEDALERQMKAEMMFAKQEFNVDSAEVLSIAAESGHPAYDCEFIALARRLRAPLVTMDQKLVKAFPQDAVLLTDFVVGGE
jgi:predicted nucleic acid-binding protein